MRLVRYRNGGQVGVGVQRGDQIFYAGFDDMMSLILAGEAGLDTARRSADNSDPVSYDRLLAPIARPGKIFGGGVNYRSHGDEDPGHVFADEPMIDFIKLSSSVIGPDEPIVIPSLDDVIRRPDGFDVDYEVEFGVVVGRAARHVRAAEALDHVFGYTLFNDVGARAVQFRNRQVDLAKGFDTFCPMGPCIVTADEMPDPGVAHIQSLVNGELRQDDYVRNQIASPQVVIEWLSSIITLDPGDCLSTGTPAGCGTFMDPPQYLKPGDVVTVREDTVGELTNPVVGAS